jgi:hypothetical protein
LSALLAFAALNGSKRASTVTVSDDAADPLRAVIVALPVAIATTRPKESTFTIFGALLVSVIGTFGIRVPLESKPRAVARAESPTLSAAFVNWRDTRAAVGAAGAAAAAVSNATTALFGFTAVGGGGPATRLRVA